MPIRVDPELLHRLLRYDPDTGDLYWREREASDFSHTRRPDVHCAIFNKRFGGKKATSAPVRGYKIIGISRTYHLKAHRAAWVLTHGVWPDQIDHINGDRGDNRLANLRAVDGRTNARNQKLRSDNSFGCAGIILKRNGKYEAQIGAGARRRSRFLGTFATLEEAIAARRAAERALGYHENHGRRGDAAEAAQ
jgi:hypothetical protein